ncbi:MAG: preprotein translocase subunit SecG [Thermodesulfobacteriota bacterium]
MEFIIPIIKVVHVLVSVVLIIVVLLQPGKGGGLGSVFGGGSSESVFGASGAVPFLTKVTRLFAVVFFITSLSLGYFSVQNIQSSVIKATPAVQEDVNTDTTVEQEPLIDTVSPESADSTQPEQGMSNTTTDQPEEANPEGN